MAYHPLVSGNDGVRWLDSEQQHVWRAYMVGTTWLLDRLDHDLQRRHGISLSEYEVLVRLAERPEGRMRMASLADALRHSRSRMTHTVKRMEKAGLVQRASVAEDGRGVDAVLTKAGQALLEAAAPSHVDAVREHFVDLASRQDLAAMGRIFDRVTDLLIAGHPEADVR